MWSIDAEGLRHGSATVLITVGTDLKNYILVSVGLIDVVDLVHSTWI